MFFLWKGLLFSVVASAVAVKTRRQIFPDLLTPDGLMPLMPTLFGSEEPKPIKLNKSWDLKPQIRKDAVRKLVRWGPFEVLGISKPNVVFFHYQKLLGADKLCKEGGEWIPEDPPSMDPIGKVITATLSNGFCQDCTVLAGKADLAFENGTRADISSGVS